MKAKRSGFTACQEVGRPLTKGDSSRGWQTLGAFPYIVSREHPNIWPKVLDLRASITIFFQNAKLLPFQRWHFEQQKVATLILYISRFRESKAVWLHGKYKKFQRVTMPTFNESKIEFKEIDEWPWKFRIVNNQFTIDKYTFIAGSILDIHIYDLNRTLVLSSHLDSRRT